MTHTNYLFTAGTMVHAFPPRTQNIAKQPEVIGLCQSFPKQDHHLTYLSLNNIKSANSIHDQTRISSKFLEERKSVGTQSLPAACSLAEPLIGFSRELLSCYQHLSEGSGLSCQTMQFLGGQLHRAFQADWSRDCTSAQHWICASFML